MINFEDELKKFHPSLEIKDAEEMICNQDLDDMADVLVKLLKDAGADTDGRHAAGRPVTRTPRN